MNIEFGNLKREELKAAVALAARAYRNYAYVALYFPDDEERFRSLHAFMNCVMKSNFGKADLLAAHQQGRLVGRATLESPSTHRNRPRVYTLPKALNILDYNNETERRISDDQARQFLMELLDGASVSALQHYGKDERNAVISRLRVLGASIRQISRLTGVSEGIVRNVQ